MRNCLLYLALALGAWLSVARAAEILQPVYIGQTGEFLLPGSTSAQSIERGIRVAVDEINRNGGVLGGRPLALVTRDDHAVPARGAQNIRDFARIPDLVAVFSGRFSPVVLDSLDVIREHRMIMLAPWSSADGVTDNDMTPNFVFRLSLKDRFAMPAMLRHAAERGFERVGLLLLNSSWGRSNLKAAQQHVDEAGVPALTGEAWFSAGDTFLLDRYRKLQAAGAQAVILVANDREGALLVNEVAALPASERMPVISHWGVTGGAFVETIRDPRALDEVDFSVVQTFSFFTAAEARVAPVLETARRLFDISRIEDIEAPVGFAHAYDLTHLLAKAIERAGTTDREAVRDALEHVTGYQGLVRDFARPFSPGNHDALGAQDVFVARYRADGTIVPIGAGRSLVRH